MHLIKFNVTMMHPWYFSHATRCKTHEKERISHASFLISSISMSSYKIFFEWKSIAWPHGYHHKRWESILLFLLQLVTYAKRAILLTKTGKYVMPEDRTHFLLSIMMETTKKKKDQHDSAFFFCISSSCYLFTFFIVFFSPFWLEKLFPFSFILYYYYCICYVIQTCGLLLVFFGCLLSYFYTKSNPK